MLPAQDEVLRPFSPHKKISRRKFLAVAMAAIGGVAIGSGEGSFGELRSDILIAEKVWREFSILFSQNWGQSYVGRKISLPQILDLNFRHETIVREHALPAGNLTHQVRLAAGLMPTYALIDRDGFGVLPTSLDTFNDPLMLKHLSTEDRRALLFKKPQAEETKKEMLFKNKKLDTLVVHGDSWVAWGGAIYGTPALIQELLSAEGYDIQVKETGLVGAGIAEHLGQAKRTNSAGANFLHLFFYQPDTDPSWDMWRLSFPDEVIEKDIENSFTFFQKKMKRWDVQVTGTTLNSTQRITRENYLASLAKEWYRVFIGKQSEYFQYDEKNNNLNKATALSPLDSRGKEFFENYMLLLRQACSEVENAAVVGLPDMGLSVTDKKIYNEQVWPLLANNLGQTPALNTNNYAELDVFKHPTWRTNLQIASQIFFNLTGYQPSAQTLETVAANVQKRLAVFKQFLLKVGSGVSQAELDQLIS